MRKTELTDQALMASVQEMMAGLIDADLGGAVLKKRIAQLGRGKSAGYRTLVATRLGERWIFLFGFQKNATANITADEHVALQTLARDLLARSDDEITQLVSTEQLFIVS